ncbi:MAG: AtpZ/AtpI family protein [Holosporales bacterium]|jgi:F0F1-type ATP synthase assembly protein I|nr:AtpZ/AtpI family protein [Holosporales bacterium]
MKKVEDLKKEHVEELRLGGEPGKAERGVGLAVEKGATKGQHTGEVRALASNKKLLVKQKKAEDKSRFFVLLYGLTFQLAVETVFIVLAWMFLGIFLDKKLALSPLFFIIGIILGMIIAGANFYRFVCLSQKFYPREKKEKKDVL